MKIFICILGGLALGINLLGAADYSVKSPDGKISATVSAENDGLYFSVSADGKVLLDRAGIGMDTSAGQFGTGAQAKKPEYKKVSQTLENALGTKRKIADNYNEMLVDFGKFSLLVRAYDEAAAYRFQSQTDDGELTVKGEKLDLPLAGDTKVIATYTKGVVSSFESPYTRTTPDGMKKAGANVASSMPFIFEKAGMKVALVESDVFDYPALRIACREGDKVPHAVFSPLPKTLVQRGNKLVAGETFDCIAKTSAKRQFPWRAFIAARRDIDLADNDTAYKLATASKIGDSSWIKAGNSTWDWWVNWNTEGVDFKCGFNEDMCKYYIDFACANDIPYITLDAGWHIGRGPLGENSYYLNSEEKSAFMEQYNKDENYVNGKPYVDIPSIVKYAHARGKKVLIWSLSKVLYAYPEKALDLFKSWGVDGLKIDFNDRDDQLMMRHMENITRLAAERQMLIEWHGCPAIAGFSRTYPNAITFEGVHGAEVNKWSKSVTPSHNVDLVFTRMLLGAMDYTPGGMRNSNQRSFTVVKDIPRVQGTRAHMAAQYVLFFSPLQMISDMPSTYMREGKLLEFIAQTPSVWDETKAIEGEIGKYVVVARRSGDKWYIGGMCDWDGREVEIDLSKILPEGGKYLAKIVRDTVNSNDIPEDYKIETKKVSADGKLKLKMQSGGGFAVRLQPYTLR